METKLKCQVCNNEDSVGVACIPGVPMSVAYGENCLRANAHPWAVLVAITACIGGLDHAADWWIKMVEDTCKHLGKTKEAFIQEVKQSLKEMDSYNEEYAKPDVVAGQEE